MNQRMRSGKSSELIVAGELIRHGVDVYMPCVDDQAIDLLLRADGPDAVRYYDVQVKSVKGYNRIVGVRHLDKQQGSYILIIHYRHDNRPDEFFYLMHDQIGQHLLEDTDWGDLIFNKPEREQYAEQTLAHLAERLSD